MNIENVQNNPLIALLGVRLSWNICPSSRIEASRTAVPIFALHPPLTQREDLSDARTTAPLAARVNHGSSLRSYTVLDTRAAVRVPPYGHAGGFDVRSLAISLAGGLLPVRCVSPTHLPRTHPLVDLSEHRRAYHGGLRWSSERRSWHGVSNELKELLTSTVTAHLKRASKVCMRVLADESSAEFRAVLRRTCEEDRAFDRFVRRLHGPGPTARDELYAERRHRPVRFVCDVFKQTLLRMFNTDQPGFLEFGFNATFDVQVSRCLRLAVSNYAYISSRQLRSSRSLR